MIIIDILAAIAIPVFLSQPTRAQDSAAKADVSTVGKEIATYYVDSTTVPTSAQASGRYVLAGADIGKVSQNVGPTLTLGATGSFVSGTKWCVDVTNPEGAQKVFKYSAKGGLETGVCAAADVA